MLNRRPATATAAAMVLAALSSPALAQSYVRPDCQPLIAAAQLTDPLSTRWYRRFWTGECDRLPRCMRGSPNWNDIVGKLVARTGASERAAVLAKACRLGPLIGLEWTRPRNVRRIDTGDLQAFRSTLESGKDIRSGLERVETEARAKIAKRAS